MSLRDPKTLFVAAGVVTLFGVIDIFVMSPLIGALHFAPAAGLLAFGILQQRNAQ